MTKRWKPIKGWKPKRKKNKLNETKTKLNQHAKMDFSTLHGVLIAGITSLAGVVGVLWHNIASNQKRTETKLDECETDRAELHKMVGGLTERIDTLEETL